MAAERRDKFDKLQVSLLCDEDASEETLPKVAFEALVDEFDLHQLIYTVDDSSTYAHAFNPVTRTWVPITPADFTHVGGGYADIKALSNGDIAVFYANATYIRVTTEAPGMLRPDSFGATDDHPIHHLPSFDERPEFFAVVHLHDDVFALFDTIFMTNYMKVDLKEDKILELEENDYYQSDEEDEEEDEGDRAPHWSKFKNVYSDYHDIGGGKCLLVAEEDENFEFPRTYILIDAFTRKYEEIPPPYPDAPANYAEYVTGMQNGDIFIVGGHLEEELRYTTRCSRFDMRTKQWHRLADSPFALTQASLTTLPDGDIMVLTPNETGIFRDDVLIYSPQTNTWTRNETPFRIQHEVMRLVLA
jgi:hypothetical protein